MARYTNRMETLKPGLEDVDWNGDQIHGIMVYFITEALVPIFESCRYPVWFFAEALSTLMTSRQWRSTLRDNLERCLTGLYAVLTIKDPRQQALMIADLPWDRGLICTMLNRVDDITAAYEAEYRSWLFAPNKAQAAIHADRLADFHAGIGAKHTNVLPYLRRAREMNGYLQEFKKVVKSKYLKYVIRTANRQADETGLQVDRVEVAHTMVVLFDDALNKYNSRKGAFTFYLNYWLKHAATGTADTFSHQYGIALTVPPSVRRQLSDPDRASDRSGLTNNLAHDLEKYVFVEDTLNPTPDMIASGTQQGAIMSKIARAVDPSGLAFLLLGLPFDPKESIFFKHNHTSHKTMPDDFVQKHGVIIPQHV